MDISTELNKIKTFRDTIELNQKERERLLNLNKDAEKQIEEICNEPELKEFISTKLQEAIDKFDLNKDKEDNEFDEYTSSTYSDGKTTTKINKRPNPNYKFNPFTDKWSVEKIEIKDGMYKITVDNIKGHKFMNPFMWELDYYYTDWFKF